MADRVRGWRIAWPIWFVASVVLAGALIWQALELRSDRRVDDRRDLAVETATDQVLDLTTLDADSVGTKLKALAARTDGDFADELNSITTTFQNIVAEKQLSATGSVDAVGVTSSSEDKASVVVASTALVSEGGADPVSRTFRMKVDMRWIEGTWKVTGMEFVS